jgi:hypothetical protein
MVVLGRGLPGAWRSWPLSRSPPDTTISGARYRTRRRFRVVPLTIPVIRSPLTVSAGSLP